MIAIEGLPGAGKTTSAKLVADSLGRDCLLENIDGHLFLDTVYVPEQRNDLATELQFLLLHFNRLVAAPTKVVTDFSPAKDLLFAELVMEPPELALFKQVYASLSGALRRQTWLPDLTVILDTPVAECGRRVAARGREFEKHMDSEWLGRLRERYLDRRNELGKRVALFENQADYGPERVAAGILNVAEGYIVA